MHQLTSCLTIYTDSSGTWDLIGWYWCYRCIYLPSIQTESCVLIEWDTSAQPLPIRRVEVRGGKRIPNYGLWAQTIPLKRVFSFLFPRSLRRLRNHSYRRLHACGGEWCRDDVLDMLQKYTGNRNTSFTILSYCTCS